MNPLRQAAAEAVRGTWIMAALTVVFLVLFVALVVWAWSKRNRQRFEEAARLPLTTSEDDS